MHLKSNSCPNGLSLLFSPVLWLQLLKAKMDAFVTSELQNFERILSFNATEESEDKRQGEDEGSREAFLKITLSMLRKMEEHELADRLQTSKRLAAFHLQMICLIME